MMDQQRGRKDKPIVPPKPAHLIVLEKRLPKPPDKVVDVNEIEVPENLSHCNSFTKEKYYGDDGYLKPVTGDQKTPGELGLEHNIKNEEPENFSGAGVRQRPLPDLPGESIIKLPWFFPVDRRKAEDFVANAQDGTFLIRPSSNSQHNFALTLWYRERPYHIPIRKRLDGKFALGTPKDLEQCFTSIENLIKNYQREELVLFSNGNETGRTLLVPLSR